MGKVINGIRVAVVTFLPGADGNATGLEGPLKITDSLPHPVGGFLMGSSIPFYTWDTWEVPIYKERTKDSYLTIKEMFKQY